MHLYGPQKTTDRDLAPPSLQGKVTSAGNLQSADGRISPANKRFCFLSSALVPAFMIRRGNRFSPPAEAQAQSQLHDSDAAFRFDISRLNCPTAVQQPSVGRRGFD
jgi:hypothetical protein